MSFFANRSSRHAARLGSALTAHPAGGLGGLTHRGRAHHSHTMRTGPAALALSLTIPFALAACGAPAWAGAIIPEDGPLPPLFDPLSSIMFCRDGQIGIGGVSVRASDEPCFVTVEDKVVCCTINTDFATLL